MIATKRVAATRVLSLQVRIERRPARRCPACRQTWPSDWEYCAHCNVWLPGTERADRRALLVPSGSGRSLTPGDNGDRLVLACEIRCPSELPSSEDLRQGRKLLRAFVAAIAASGGTARVVRGAGVTGSWCDDLGSASAAAAAAVVGAKKIGSLSARRVRFGIGISSTGGHPDVQDLAFRLASLAGSDSVLVCEETYRRTRQRFDYRGVGPIVPRSDPLPGPAFQLIGAKLERSGSRQAGPERAALVGRSALLRALDECRERVVRGSCVVVHLIGEPGSGKSKLIREWLGASDREHRLAGWLRLETDGVPYGGFPLRAWKRLTADLERGQEIRRSVIRGSISGEMRQRLQASSLPALLVVDDLHWVDGPSRGALGNLLKGIADLPVLVLLAYRPSFAGAPNEPARPHRKLRLPGLRHRDMLALVTKLAAGAGTRLSSADREAIVARTLGNPLYAEEAVTHLAEAADRVSASSLPPSLPELLIDRIRWTLEHALPELERRHREGLFVQGMAFALGAEPAAILRSLDVLEERVASWLDRFDVIEGERQSLVAQFLEGLDAIDGRLALLNVLVGRQRPHCGRLAQALARLGAGRESSVRGGPIPGERAAGAQ